MTTFLILLLLLQQEEHVSRSQKAPYQDATRQCDRAQELIKEAPEEAVEILTRVIENRKIKKMECRLKIELRVGFFSKPHDFFPYQFRGKAFLSLAGKTNIPKEAEGFYQKAKKDFEESLRRKNQSSQIYLDEAKKQLLLLQKIDPPDDPIPVNPEIEFQEKWRTLLNQQKFRSAEALVETEGSVLPPEKRLEYKKKVTQECRKYISNVTSRFLIDLQRVVRQRDPFANLSKTLQEDLRLTKEEELTIRPATYRWCGELRSTLSQFEKKKKIRIDSLIDLAIQSIPLTEAPATNPWLIAIGTLTHSHLLSEIKQHLAKAKNALKEDRMVHTLNATQLMEEWVRLETRVAKTGKTSPFAPQMKKPLQDQIALFPKDYDGLKQIEMELEKSIQSSDPERGLLKIERSLEKSRSKWRSLSLESRREIVRYIILCRALNRFFTGKTTEEITKELIPLGKELQGLGGSFTVTRFGPKIEELFQKLR